MRGFGTILAKSARKILSPRVRGRGREALARANVEHVFLEGLLGCFEGYLGPLPLRAEQGGRVAEDVGKWQPVRAAVVRLDRVRSVRGHVQEERWAESDARSGYLGRGPMDFGDPQHQALRGVQVQP